MPRKKSLKKVNSPHSPSRNRLGKHKSGQVLANIHVGVKLKKNPNPTKNLTSNLTTQALAFLEKFNKTADANQSRLSLILGGLIILVVGILLFNYFSRQTPSLGPAQNTESTQTEQQDVSVNSLPGKYQVKEGDTLFLIAEKYYKDGGKYLELVKTNNLSDPDLIEAGVTIEIPKLATDPATAVAANTIQLSETVQSPTQDTTWGPAINSKTYMVKEGDWLSTISGRAYGDIYAFSKIAAANNISDANLIEPGTILTIPQ